jgi:hypothetical protein
MYESIFKKGLIKNTIKSIMPAASVKKIEISHKVVDKSDPSDSALDFTTKRTYQSSNSLIAPLFDEYLKSP